MPPVLCGTHLPESRFSVLNRDCVLLAIANVAQTSESIINAHL